MIDRHSLNNELFDIYPQVSQKKRDIYATQYKKLSNIC